MNDFICGCCKKVKQRINDGIIGGQAAYKDENGKRWQRRVCPACYSKKQVERRAKQARVYRREKHALMKVAKHYTVYVAPGTKLRPCNRCKAKTPNYYYCSTCYSTMRGQNSIALAEVEFFYG